MTKQVRQLGYENFEEFTHEGGLVAFTSVNCPPCRALKPQLKLYAERGHSVGTVDLDESPDLFSFRTGAAHPGLPCESRQPIRRTRP